MKYLAAAALVLFVVPANAQGWCERYNPYTGQTYRIPCEQRPLYGPRYRFQIPEYDPPHPSTHGFPRPREPYFIDCYADPSHPRCRGPRF